MSVKQRSYIEHSDTANLGFAMSVSHHFNCEYPHVVFFPSGIGNLTLFYRLAVKVASNNCKVTFIKIQSQVNDPEFMRFSCFVSNHPKIELLELEIHSQKTPSESTINDPFITRIENIKSSLHQLNPILSSSHVTAIISDFVLAAKVTQLFDHTNIPVYILSTTSALFFATVAYLPVLMDNDPNIFSDSCRNIEIPGLPMIPKPSIPPTWLNDSASNYLLEAYLLPNARSLSKVKGVLLNTYDWFESETIAALQSCRVLNSLPQVFAIGPLQPYKPKKSYHLPWLNEQLVESVVYVNFGSQETMSLDQIRELGKGLQICGYKYLWVLTNIEDLQDNLNNESRGKIVKGVVCNEEVLAHPAIGGFISQCEWDSIMYAARYGVPTLAWPQHGDQKMNAATVEKAGLGILVKDWCWTREVLVKGEEISQLLKQVMGDLDIKEKAKLAREKAKEACEIGGSSEEAFVELMKCLVRGR